MKWLLVLFLLFIFGCVTVKESNLECNAPYIQKGTACCLDSNSNNICDNDENIQDKVAITSQVKVIDFIPESYKDCDHITEQSSSILPEEGKQELEKYGVVDSAVIFCNPNILIAKSNKASEYYSYLLDMNSDLPYEGSYYLRNHRIEKYYQEIAGGKADSVAVVKIEDYVIMVVGEHLPKENIKNVVDTALVEIIDEFT